MIDALPSSCALIAVSACYELARHGVQCRPLAVTYRRKPLHRHIVTVFAFEDRLRVYDSDGSLTLPEKLTLNTNPSTLATAWATHPSSTFGHKALKGEWY